MSEILYCEICKRDIKKIGCHPIYSEKFGIICSDCCLLGCAYHLGELTIKQFEAIPKDIRDKIIMIYEK